MRTGPNIYKRKDGRWEARVLLARKPGGRSRYKYLYASTYREAARAKTNYESALSASIKITPMSTLSFSKAAKEWLEAFQKKWKPATYNKYVNCLQKYVLPEWEAVAAAGITQECYDALISHLEETLSGSSLRTINTVIIGCLKHSLKCVPILCKTPPENPKNTKPVTLSEQEATRLTAALRERSDLSAVGILLALYSGVRIGELCALRWEDICMEQQVLHICHTLQRVQIPHAAPGQPRTRIQLGPPKNKREREIPIHSGIFTRLQELGRIYPPSAYLLSGTEKPVEPRTMANRFKRILKDTGIRNIHFHALRHTFATRYVEADISIPALSEMLGHSSIKITVDRYVHLSRKFKQEQIEALQFTDVVSKNPPGNSGLVSEVSSRQESRQRASR